MKHCECLAGQLRSIRFSLPPTVWRRAVTVNASRPAGMSDRVRETAEAARLARRATELGRNDAVALCTAGFALAYVVGRVEDGDALIDQALALNGNLAWAWYFSGWAKVY